MRFQDLADVLHVDLVSWGELDGEAQIAANAGRHMRIRASWRPEWMPDDLFQVPRKSRFSKAYRDDLGDWYEGAVARAYYAEGYEVFMRSEVCGRVEDGGVDLVCVLW